MAADKEAYRESTRTILIISSFEMILSNCFQIQIQIQNSLFSTQHIVHTTMVFYTYDVSKRERAEDGAYVGSFPNIII